VDSSAKICPKDIIYFSPKDFECPLCCEVFLDPTTILCGHSFCTDCLQRVFDTTHYGQAQCPICRRYFFQTSKPSLNFTLNDIIKKYLPEDFHRRQKERTEWGLVNGSWLPLFVLSIVVFPKQIVKLHVYEPRYRLMIRRCLSSSSTFGIILGDARVGTEVSIKECIPLVDGRFYITILGKRRFRVLETQNMDGYPIAKYDEMTETIEEGLNSYITEITNKIGTDVNLPLTAYFENLQISNAYDFSMGIASILPIRTIQRQEMLEITSTKARLEIALEHIRRHNESSNVSSWLLLMLFICIFFHSLSFIELPYQY